MTPFKSIKSAAADLVPVVGSIAQMFVKDNFDNLSKIEKISSPLLFIHGTNDKIVPHSHSQALYGKKFFIKKKRRVIVEFLFSKG